MSGAFGQEYEDAYTPMVGDVGYGLSGALDAIEKTLRKCVVLKQEEHYVAIALWIAHTHAITEFDFTPRLAIWSPEKRCGKSLLLEIISYLVPDGIMTSNISAPALYRSIDLWPEMVYLIDESDSIFGRFGDKEKAEALRGIMNSGFKRGVWAIRCEGEKQTPKKYQLFSPVVLAGIGTDSIPETVADRSIIIEMRRKFPGENITEFESDEVEGIFSPLKESLTQWMALEAGKLRSLKPTMPEELNSRARDVWKPMYKIATQAGEEWLEKAWNASILLSSEETQAEDGSLSYRLLFDIREVFTGEQMTSTDLIQALVRLEESPWSSRDTFTPHSLSFLLKDYSIKPSRFSGGGRVRGYQRKDFEEAWKAYLPEISPSPDDLFIEYEKDFNRSA